jgi:hypothetical protein
VLEYRPATNLPPGHRQKVLADPEPPHSTNLVGCQYQCCHRLPKQKLRAMMAEQQPEHHLEDY